MPAARLMISLLRSRNMSERAEHIVVVGAGTAGSAVYHAGLEPNLKRTTPAFISSLAAKGSM